MKKVRSNLLVVMFFGCLFGFLVLYLSLTEFTCTDETWNFQSIFKMNQGGAIYKDNNVIDTPLFFVIGNVIFGLFGANLNVFRAYNVGIYLAKFILIYGIFRKCKISKILSGLYTLIWVMLDFPYMPTGANYNQLALVFSLMGVGWYLANYEKKMYDLVQGIFIFLVFFTKQTVGVYYAFGVVLFELIGNGFGKRFFQKQGLKLATFLPCLLIACWMMYVKGNLLDFLNMCFGSILEFAQMNRSFDWKNAKYLMIMLGIAVFAMVILHSKNVSKQRKMDVLFFLCLSIGNSFNMLPLMNEYHIHMALLFYYLLFLLIVDRLLICEVLDVKKYQNMMLLIGFCILYVFYLKVGFMYFVNYRDLTQFESDSPFYNTAVSYENRERIGYMTEYIKKKEEAGTQVLVLSYEAAAYMVPLKKNNGAFDMLLCGNLGYHGIQRTIEKISNRKNTEFLIFTDEEDCHYQESSQIRAYLEEHLQKKGEFLKYSIYTKE